MSHLCRNASALSFAASICPYPLTGVSDEDLADVIDAWLADQFASADHRHIHNWHEEDGR